MLIKFRHIIFLPIFLVWLIVGEVISSDQGEYEIDLKVKKENWSMHSQSHWQKIVQDHIIELQSKGTFNVSSLEQRLRIDPWVKTANVYKTMPNTWHITIQEKKPIAVMEYGRSKKLLNNVATEMNVTEKYLSENQLPKVQVLNGQVNLDSVALLVNYLNKEQLPRNNYVLKITEDGYGIHFYEHNEKKTAYLSHRKPLRKQLDKFKIFYSAVWSKQFEAYYYINLSIPTQVIAKQKI